MTEQEQQAAFRTVLAQHGAIAAHLRQIYFDRGYNANEATSDMASMITLCEQLGNLLTGQATNAADYQTTLNQWRTDM